MLYAVVDIETTGSHASANGITEIGIVIHDGERTLNFYETLVNPHLPIPYFIQRLTGINDSMVCNAPAFSEIAGQVYELLQDKVFVAHNVNFDYSFVKYQLQQCGYELDTRKLCTVRLSRKVFPDIAGYSLGKLTTRFGINHAMHHRAGGDALATADLLAILIKNDKADHLGEMLKGKSTEQYIPPHLPIEQIERLPSVPGVYYFYDAKGKVIYIGKAKNIRKRVRSHFSNNKINRQKQEFMKETHSITYKECATELMAHILESTEIRKLWPTFNRSQKGYLPQFGLFGYHDRVGYKRLAIEKNKFSFAPIYSFNSINEGNIRVRELIGEFGLCPHLCNLSGDIECGCDTHADPDEYNVRVEDAIAWLKKHLPSFALLDKGMNDNDYSCILVKEGILSGMGYITDRKKQVKDIDTLTKTLEPVQDNDYIRNLVLRHAVEYPEKCVMF